MLRKATMKTKVNFTLKGFSYRTDGETVEALDGNTWNKTHSIPVILHARDIFAKTTARKERERFDSLTPNEKVAEFERYDQ